ncbi:MAG: glutamyl-tRNA reductase [Chloroflexi bacterium]|nr:glutamyl-tRNA reductase [Chloroflexota bacterium]
MTLIVVGMNHRTAPVALREQLALSGERLRTALDELVQDSGIHEAVILSTCNRLEVYADAIDDVYGWHVLEQYLADMERVTLAELKPSLYYLAGEEVVTHLLNVASGLDSMILGEPQILGQVNCAYGEAHGVGVTGPVLSRLFTQAVHCGKRARTETDISRHTTSVSHAAVKLAQRDLKDLTKVNALIVGAGEMAELAANALSKYHCQSITFINRTHSRAEDLASQYNGLTRSWHLLLESLKTADVVISSTGAPHPVIHTEEVNLILPYRNGRPLLFIDIAVPRDVEEGVGELPTVISYDIDDLNRVVDENGSKRAESARAAAVIVEQEAEEFMIWLHSREVVPVIVELRRRVADIAGAEVSQALNRLDGLTKQEQQIVDRLAHRIVNKILHEPTTRLKEQAVEGNGELYGQILSELFGLNGHGRND